MVTASWIAASASSQRPSPASRTDRLFSEVARSGRNASGRAAASSRRMPTASWIAASASSRRPSPMPVRYTATPDGAGMANMLAPVDGSFGYVHGVLTQTTAGEPVEWQYPGRSPAPYAIIGRNTWRDYTVSARVVLPASGTESQPPGAALIARFQGFRRSIVSRFRGYELKVRGNGAWQLVANGPATVTLASGSVAATDAYTLSLTTRGTTISARIDGVLVATATDRRYRYGPAGLGSLGYYPVRYPSFTVRYLPAAPTSNSDVT